MGKVKNLVELKKALDFSLNIDIIKKVYLNTDGKLFFTYDDHKIVEVNNWELSENEKKECLEYLIKDEDIKLDEIEKFLKIRLQNKNVLGYFLSEKENYKGFFWLTKPATNADNLNKFLTNEQKEYLKNHLLNNRPILVVGDDENTNIKLLNSILSIQTKIDKENEPKRTLTIDDVSELFYEGNYKNLKADSLKYSSKSVIMKEIIGRLDPIKTFVSNVNEDDDILTYLKFMYCGNIINTTMKTIKFCSLDKRFPKYFEDLKTDNELLIVEIKINVKGNYWSPIEFEFLQYKKAKLINLRVV